MNVGLSFLQQIQRNSVSDLATWIGSSLKQVIVAITDSYHIQHNIDDTHKAITSTGAITERSRTLPQGVWTDVGIQSVAFSNGWTVVPASFLSMAYMLIGTSLVLDWSFVRTSLGNTPDTLTFTVGTTITPTRTTHGTFHYNDNGTYGVGRATIAPVNTGAGGVRVTLAKVNLAVWAVSDSNTDLSGQMACEVSGV